ncbi:MAG: DUF6691 family protein [Labilithrix sp.]
MKADATRLFAAGAAGAIFAFGLGLSGMTNPAKVIGFLDVAGAWDPSLAFVMAGAIGAHFLVARWSKTAEAPLLGGDFVLPSSEGIDRRLLAGAALFGLGWGASGYCPGPAIAGAASLAPSTCLFLVTMVATIAAYRYFVERIFPSASKSSSTPDDSPAPSGPTEQSTA